MPDIAWDREWNKSFLAQTAVMEKHSVAASAVTVILRRRQCCQRGCISQVSADTRGKTTIRFVTGVTRVRTENRSVRVEWFGARFCLFPRWAMLLRRKHDDSRPEMIIHDVSNSGKLPKNPPVYESLASRCEISGIDKQSPRRWDIRTDIFDNSY